RYLRETSPFYIYSNPIMPAEAAAALKAIDVVDSPSGAALLRHLRLMIARFKAGLIRLGFETLLGEPPGRAFAAARHCTHHGAGGSFAP
ncbi:MAG: hypothetical protein WAM03_14725, partial [Pseudolabrys sp.]